MDIVFSEDYVFELQTENRKLKAKLETSQDEREGYRQHFEAARIRIDQLNAKVTELEAGTMGQLLLRALRERDEAKACMAELKDKLREPWRRVNIFPGDQPAPESLSCMYVHCWFEKEESWAAKRIAALEEGDRWVDPRLPDQRGEGE